MLSSLRKMWNVSLCLLLCLLTSHCYGRLHMGTPHCWGYDDDNQCTKDKGCQPEKKIIDCADTKDSNGGSLDLADNYMQCYTMWNEDSYGNKTLVKMGCWLNNESCKNVSECVETEVKTSSFVCCCDSELCNEKYRFAPNTKMTKKPEKKTVKGIQTSIYKDERNKIIMYCMVPIVVICLLVVSLYLLWRRHKHHMGHHQLPTVDPTLVQTPSDPPLSIQLLEQKAKGRFGFVWRAKLADQYVAVKIFPMGDKKSFTSEVDIYKGTNMSHENVLRFIYAQVKEDNAYTEFYLITEYHERGSLYDFLKANTLTWTQLCQIGETMMCGLAYLHDEIPGAQAKPLKPAIAHRDFKSKNVLIKLDGSACLADFGLALAFYPDMGVNETHTQVGTRRYMAPEVLEGAICFNMDSFLRIDMYACSLVIWELMSRCTCVEDVVDEYRLPFEAEVGLHPSLEEMQPLVAGEKRRPIIKPAWFQSSGMASLVATMEECWDQDAEARLSAGCVHDRIQQLSRTVNSGDANLPVSPAPPPAVMYANNNQRSPLLPSSPVGNNNHSQHQQSPPSYSTNSTPLSSDMTGNSNSNSMQIYYNQPHW